MSILADLAGKVVDVAGKFIPDADKRMEMQGEVLRMAHEAEQAQLKSQTDLALAQAQINQVEAGSANVFVSGWRPAVGWVCVIALAYAFFLRPVLSPFSHKWLGVPLEAIELGDLMTLLFGMLGLGVMRTVEKFKGVTK